MARLPIQASSATSVTMEGREYLAFAGNNYAALAHHPEVVRALCDAAAGLGLTTTASRETTGNTVTHEALEAELAEFTGFPASILTAEGYAANIALAQSLARDYSVAVIDETSHRSISHSLNAAGFKIVRYKHLSAEDCGAKIGESAPNGRVVVFTDSVFAADGAIAPLPGLLEMLPEQGVLIADDCHGFCVLGRRGRGTIDHFGLSDPRLVLTTTLAKGLGCYGGLVAASPSRIDSVRTHAGIYRGSTPIPPPMAHAARAALRVIGRDDSVVRRLRENTLRLRTGLVALGIHTNSDEVPIVAFVISPSERMEQVHAMLLEAGFLAPLIEYPGGPSDRYFRWTVNAAHTPAQIDSLLGTFAALMDKTEPAGVKAQPPASLATPTAA
jgi:8-amino-7-oxononanoate synthase